MDAVISYKLKPFQTPNFATVEQSPRPKQEGVQALPSIPINELSDESLDNLVNQWRAEVYLKAKKSLPELRRPTPMTNDKALEAALLACPFCGGSPEDHWPTSTTKHFIQCGGCGARTSINVASHGGSARDDWNRRTPLSALPGEAEVVGLVERLRTYRPANEWGDPVHHTICDEAASRLLSLASQKAEYAEALKQAGRTIQHNITRAEEAESSLRRLQSASQSQGVEDGNALQAMQARAEKAERERDEALRLAGEDVDALQAIGEEFGIKPGERRVTGVRRLLTEYRTRVKELEEEVANLRAATNQSRLAFSGMVSVQSAIDLLDKLGGSNG